VRDQAQDDPAGADPAAAGATRMVSGSARSAWARRRPKGVAGALCRLHLPRRRCSIGGASSARASTGWYGTLGPPVGWLVQVRHLPTLRAWGSPRMKCLHYKLCVCVCGNVESFSMMSLMRRVCVRARTPCGHRAWLFAWVDPPEDRMLREVLVVS
jgi:hypothetical protein